MRKLISILMLASIPVAAFAQDRPIVAVFDIDAKGQKLSPSALNGLADYLATLLTARGYQVIPRSQLKDRLKAQSKESYKACYDQSCQIELGKELAAQKSLSTQIIKLGKKCMLTLNLYDLGKAASERAGAAEGGCTEDDLVTSLKAAVDNLMGVPAAVPGPAPGPGPSAAPGPAVAAPPPPVVPTTVSDFLGTWDFLHSGNRDESTTWESYTMKLDLDGSGNLSFLWKQRMRSGGLYPCQTDWDIPGAMVLSCQYAEGEAPNVSSTNYRVGIVRHIPEKRAVMITWQQEGQEFLTLYLVLSRDGTKLIMGSENLAVEGKDQDQIAKHLVPQKVTVDGKESSVIFFSYAVKKSGPGLEPAKASDFVGYWDFLHAGNGKDLSATNKMFTMFFVPDGKGGLSFHEWIFTYTAKPGCIRKVDFPGSSEVSCSGKSEGAGAKVAAKVLSVRFMPEKRAVRCETAIEGEKPSVTYWVLSADGGKMILSDEKHAMEGTTEANLQGFNYGLRSSSERVSAQLKE